MDPQRKPLAVGVVGLCHLHPRSYMPVFGAVEDFKVTAVAESNTQVLDSFANDFPVKKYADWREMLEREPLDLAAIYLPHAECPEAACASWMKRRRRSESPALALVSALMATMRWRRASCAL